MTTPTTQAQSGAELDLQQLKALALAATTGKWKMERLTNGGYHNVGIRVHGSQVSGYAAVINTRWTHEAQQAEQESNATYIAAANPAVVLDLIARIERQSLSLEAVAAALGDHFDAEVGHALSVRRVIKAWQAEAALGETYKGIAQDSARIERATAPHADEKAFSYLPQYAFERNGEVHHYFRTDDVYALLDAPHGSAAPTEAAPIPAGWEPMYLTWNEQIMAWVDVGLAEYEEAEEADRRIAYKPKEKN